MASNAELTDEQKLRKLKFARRGIKTSITSRVKQLEKLCEEQAKKRMITFLTGCLQTVFNELEQVCLEISTLTPEVEDEYNDIEEIRIKVETCVAIVTAHLESRADEGVSASSLTSSWVARHAVGGIVDDLTSDRGASGQES